MCELRSAKCALRAGWVVIPSERRKRLSFRASGATTVIPSERSDYCHSERAERVEESALGRRCRSLDSALRAPLGMTERGEALARRSG